MPTIIETDRLILREFELSDYQAVYEFGSNKEVQKYTGEKGIESESPQKAKELIENVSFEDYKNYGYGRWAVVLKSESKVIGFAGLKYLIEIDETDIGFRFLPQYWNKGIATEASIEIIKYGFENLKLERIIAIAMQKNIGSWKVFEKTGLKFYKTGEYDGDGGDHRWYKIEKSEYFD